MMNIIDAQPAVGCMTQLTVLALLKHARYMRELSQFYLRLLSFIGFRSF
jgi:hypothetical protein